MFDYKSDKLIMVYQAGKVASKSIDKSLESLGYTSTAPHSMGKNVLYQIFPNYKDPYLRSIKKITKVLIKYAKRKTLLFLYKRRKMKIITVVREPISRNMSSYFQDIHIPLMHIAANHSMVNPKNTNISKLISEYFRNFNQNFGINWFDNELKKYFGVDAYKYEFNKEKGYDIIKKGNIEVLIIKYEKLGEVGEKCIGDFIGNSEFRIVNRNTSQEKWYSPVYENFKKEIKFDDIYLDDMLNNKYVKHFYTEEEILGFYNKYRRIEN